MHRWVATEARLPPRQPDAPVLMPALVQVRLRVPLAISLAQEGGASRIEGGRDGDAALGAVGDRGEEPLREGLGSAVEHDALPGLGTIRIVIPSDDPDVHLPWQRKRARYLEDDLCVGFGGLAEPKSDELHAPSRPLPPAEEGADWQNDLGQRASARAAEAARPPPATATSPWRRSRKR